MSEHDPGRQSSLTTAGLGLAGVVGFSLTLPVTRYAVPAFGPAVVGPGRSLLAAAVAAVVLLAARRPLLPPRASLRSVLIVAAGSVVGFPLLTAIALKTVSASHAAVILAFLPAATAVMAVVRGKERPARIFWIWCACGTALIGGYLASNAELAVGRGDLELIVAVLLCALGYAEGGVLGRTIPGWLITCWSVIVSIPAVVVILLITGSPPHGAATWQAVAAFAYLAIGSSLVAFFCWYRALAAGGIAKVGQIQLLQPILTMLFAALLLGEPLKLTMILTGVGVGATVLMAQRARVRPASTPTVGARQAVP